jgi:transcription elongation factor GreB
VTPNGLKQLETEADSLEQARAALKSEKKDSAEQDPMTRQKIAMIDRDLRYIGARLSSAILVDNTQNPDANTVLFGATVTVEDEDGELHVFTIVGEDEADMACNKVSYLSPIAKALIGRKVGDNVEWQRPIGNTQLTIIKIR